MGYRWSLSLVAFTLLSKPCLGAQDALAPGCRLFIRSDGTPFHDEFAAALVKKSVPVEQVDKEADADFVVSGSVSATNHLGSIFPQASANLVVSIADKTGAQVFSCSSSKGRAYNGYKSVAEQCTKRLKERLANGK